MALLKTKKLGGDFDGRFGAEKERVRKSVGLSRRSANSAELSARDWESGGSCEGR